MKLDNRQQKHHDAFMDATKGMSASVVARAATLQTPGITWTKSSCSEMADYYAGAKAPTKGRSPVFRSMGKLDLDRLRRDCAALSGVPYVPLKTPGQLHFESWGFAQAWADVSPAERRHYEKAAKEQAGKPPLNFMAPEYMDPAFVGRITQRDGQPFPEAAKRVALHMWKAAGEPEKDSEPTSVGRAWYDDRAADVLRGLAELGYRVTRPSPKRKQKRA